MTPVEAAQRLRERATSYSHDASALRRQGHTDDAPMYEAIAKELREAADQLNPKGPR